MNEFLFNPIYNVKIINLLNHNVVLKIKKDCVRSV